MKIKINSGLYWSMSKLVKTVYFFEMFMYIWSTLSNFAVIESGFYTITIDKTKDRLNTIITTTLSRRNLYSYMYI